MPRWRSLRSLVMAEGDDDGTFRDLRSLVVPAAGALVETGDPWEPYWLSDPTGVRIGPVSEYLRDLQATGRPATTQRSYSFALLRWFRFCWAVGVSWDQATRTEARDFCRHLLWGARTVPSALTWPFRRPCAAPHHVQAPVGVHRPFSGFADLSGIGGRPVLLGFHRHFGETGGHDVR